MTNADLIQALRARRDAIHAVLRENAAMYNRSRDHTVKSVRRAQYAMIERFNARILELI